VRQQNFGYLQGSAFFQAASQGAYNAER
jgi:hypothetical protein